MASTMPRRPKPASPGEAILFDDGARIKANSAFDDYLGALQRGTPSQASEPRNIVFRLTGVVLTHQPAANGREAWRTP